MSWPINLICRPTNSPRTCSRCGRRYQANGFGALIGDGEKNNAKIVLYGDTYYLCAHCTRTIHREIRIPTIK